MKVGRLQKQPPSLGPYLWLGLVLHNKRSERLFSLGENYFTKRSEVITYIMVGIGIKKVIF